MRRRLPPGAFPTRPNSIFSRGEAVSRTVYFRKDEWEMLRKRARFEGCSLSAIIRRACIEYLRGTGHRVAVPFEDWRQ